MVVVAEQTDKFVKRFIFQSDSSVLKPLNRNKLSYAFNELEVKYNDKNKANREFTPKNIVMSGVLYRKHLHYISGAETPMDYNGRVYYHERVAKLFEVLFKEYERVFYR